MPNEQPLPYIRYTRELTQSVADQKRISAAAAAKSSEGRKNGATAAAGTQTAFRDSEAQTDPCTLDRPRETVLGIGEAKLKERPEILALEALEYERGLPVRDEEDLDVVRGLLEQDKLLRRRLDRSRHRGKAQLRASLRRTLENKCKIDWSLREHFSNRAKTRRHESIRSAVDAFSLASEQMVEEKLRRLSRKQEIDVRQKTSKMDNAHRKELRALELKHQAASSKLTGPKASLAKLKAAFERQQSGQAAAAVPAEDNLSRNPREFEKKMQELAALDRKMTRELDKKIVGCKTAAGAIGSGGGGGDFLPRNERYDHLLDTVYEEIQCAKRTFSTASSVHKSSLEPFRRQRQQQTMRTIKDVPEQRQKQQQQQQPRLSRGRRRRVERPISVDLALAVESDDDDSSVFIPSSVLSESRRRQRMSRQESYASSSFDAADDDSSAIAAAIVDDVLAATAAEHAVQQHLRSEVSQLLATSTSEEGEGEEDEETVLATMRRGGGGGGSGMTESRIPRAKFRKYVDHLVLSSLASAVEEVLDKAAAAADPE